MKNNALLLCSIFLFYEKRTSKNFAEMAEKPAKSS